MSSLPMVSLIMAISLLLQMHACIARHPSHFVSFTKLQDADKIKLVRHEMVINGFPVLEAAKEISSEDVAFGGVVDKNEWLMTEVQELKGKPRAMLESSKAKEATDANEGEPAKEAAATDEDYVQIHHRSPIHNHH